MSVFVVLAGGLNENGTLPDYVLQRLDFALNRIKKKDKVIFSSIFSLNTKQIFDKSGKVKSEANEMRKIFKSMSFLEDDDLYIENASFDTLGSAFFIRICFEFLWSDQEIKVITSDFHLERTKFIFSKIMNYEPIPSYKSLNFFGVKSQIETGNRVEKEKKSLKAIENTLSKFSNFLEFNRWILSCHDNYNQFMSKVEYNDNKKYEYLY